MNSKKNNIELFYGPIAGLFEGIIMQPVDTLKNLKQSNQFSGFKNIKIRHLYKGFIPYVSQMSFKYFLRFTTFNKLKSENDNYMRNFSAGLAAGVIESLFITPFELVKTNLQTTNNKYIINVIKDIIHINGVKGLYRGFLPTCIRQSINQSFNFSIYFKLKSMFIHKNEKPDIFKIIGITFLSSSVGPLLNNPFDVIKTRYQNPKYKYTNMLQSCKDIIKNEGFFTLWKGVELRLFRVCGGQIITFYTIENMSFYLK